MITGRGPSPSPPPAPELSGSRRGHSPGGRFSRRGRAQAVRGEIMMIAPPSPTNPPRLRLSETGGVPARAGWEGLAVGHLTSGALETRSPERETEWGPADR